MTNEAVRQPTVPARDAVESALLEIAEADSAILAAYLFGSLARGAAGPLSDVDIGLLTRDRESDRAVCERATDALCRRLSTSRIEVISLEEASVPLRYRVVRDGALLVCRDAAVVERFVTDTVLQYLDFKPLRDRAFEVMRAAILADR